MRCLTSTAGRRLDSLRYGEWSAVEARSKGQISEIRCQISDFRVSNHWQRKAQLDSRVSNLRNESNNIRQRKCQKIFGQNLTEIQHQSLQRFFFVFLR